MAEQDMFQTSDLVPLLAERSVVLSREQVYRLVTQPPQRRSMDALVALCDILDRTPNDLIKPEVVNEQVRKTADDDGGPASHHATPLGYQPPRPPVKKWQRTTYARSKARDLAMNRARLVACVQSVAGSTLTAEVVEELLRQARA